MSERINTNPIMSIYEDTVNKVEQGARFSVDFRALTLKVNRKKVKLEGDFGIPTFDTLDEWLDHVEELYDAYKYSRPSQTSMNASKHTRFKALRPDELVAECGHLALSNPLKRETARASLEAFILLSVAAGAVDLDELFAKDWFYQGRDKSLVILKDWFTPTSDKQ